MACVGVLKVDGEALEYFYRKGRGQTIVFIPALGFDWTYWGKSVGYFARKGYGVLALTLRGHSSSRTRLKAISIGDHVMDVKLLLLKLGITKPFFVGASLGGVVAAALHAGNKSIRCVCVNAPVYFNREIRFSVRLLVFLLMPIVWLDWLTRPGWLRFDFSRSRLTNNVAMALKGALKFNTYGFYLNYACLKNSRPLEFKGCITVSSRHDEVFRHVKKSDFIMDGNHNCAVSNSQGINAIIDEILSKKSAKE